MINESIDALIIDSFLTTKQIGRKISVFSELESTNTYAKNLTHPRQGETVIAKTQTKGRGRRGKTFFSPDNSGLYLSVILDISTDGFNPGLITSCVAVAVAHAIEDVAPVTAQIKWINDIYINRKKVCGILAEALLREDGTALDRIVLGIGINIKKVGFPKELEDIATSIENECDKIVSINLLAAKVLNRLEEELENMHTLKFLEESRKRSIVIGREITVIKNGERQTAKAIGIDDNGYLEVIINGKEEKLTGGEVSIKL